MNNYYVAYDVATGVIVLQAETKTGLKVRLTCARKREAKRNANREERHRDHRMENCVIVSIGDYDQNVRRTKTVRSLMNGAEIEIDINTPAACDPSSETYWSM